MHRLRRHLSLPNALAGVALFIALGGVAYAGSQIGTDDIQNGAVTNSKLRGNAVTSPKIANGSVTGLDVAEATLSNVPDANRTGGMRVQKFTATPEANTPLTTVATVGTLDLKFGCNASGGPLLTVTPRNGAPEQGMKGSFIDGAEAPHSVASGTVPPGGVVVLDGNAPSADGGINASTAGGAVTTVQWAARSSVLLIPGGPNPNPDHCFFYGTAISG